MSRPTEIILGDGSRIPILYEDRSVLAIDKPAGWMLVPFSWQKTDRNLAAAIASSIQRGDFWARSRGIRFLRNVHRLDADTSGVLLMAKSLGAVHSLSRLFESRQMAKRYLAIVVNRPARQEWSCHLKLAPDAKQIGRMKVDSKNGKPAETHFRVLAWEGGLTLLESTPVTGRTHQIRVHLASAGLPVLGDDLYAITKSKGDTRIDHKTKFPLALRAAELAYRDPFTGRSVRIAAPDGEFLSEFGFGSTWKGIAREFATHVFGNEGRTSTKKAPAN